MTEPGKNPRLRYEEGCLGAHALNLVGDRWALLVVREPRGDFLLEGTGNALAAAVYGPGPVTLAGAGLVSLRGDKAAAQAFTDLFSLRPQTRSSSASPEDSAQVPGLSST